jgi:hypothetical protein
MSESEEWKGSEAPLRPTSALEDAEEIVKRFIRMTSSDQVPTVPIFSLVQLDDWGIELIQGLTGLYFIFRVLELRISRTSQQGHIRPLDRCKVAVGYIPVKVRLQMTFHVSPFI